MSCITCCCDSILVPVQLLCVVIEKSEALHQMSDQAAITAGGLEVDQQATGGTGGLRG